MCDAALRCEGRRHFPLGREPWFCPEARQWLPSSPLLAAAPSLPGACEGIPALGVTSMRPVRGLPLWDALARGVWGAAVLTWLCLRLWALPQGSGGCGAGVCWDSVLPLWP